MNPTFGFINSNGTPDHVTLAFVILSLEIGALMFLASKFYKEKRGRCRLNTRGNTSNATSKNFLQLMENMKENEAKLIANGTIVLLFFRPVQYFFSYDHGRYSYHRNSYSRLGVLTNIEQIR